MDSDVGIQLKFTTIASHYVTFCYNESSIDHVREYCFPCYPRRSGVCSLPHQVSYTTEQFLNVVFVYKKRNQTSQQHSGRLCGFCCGSHVVPCVFNKRHFEPNNALFFFTRQLSWYLENYSLRRVGHKSLCFGGCFRLLVCPETTKQLTTNQKRYSRTWSILDSL